MFNLEVTLCKFNEGKLILESIIEEGTAIIKKFIFKSKIFLTSYGHIRYVSIIQLKRANLIDKKYT